MSDDDASSMASSMMASDDDLDVSACSDQSGGSVGPASSSGASLASLSGSSNGSNAPLSARRSSRSREGTARRGSISSLSPSPDESTESVEEKKTRRLLRNREAARKNRSRKKQWIEDLLRRYDEAKTRVDHLHSEMAAAEGLYRRVSSQMIAAGCGPLQEPPPPTKPTTPPALLGQPPGGVNPEALALLTKHRRPSTASGGSAAQGRANGSLRRDRRGSHHTLSVS